MWLCNCYFKMKILTFILLSLCSVIVVAVVDQYLFCPVYTFANATPFSGDSIYNPYAFYKQNNWVKCNFHSHIHCWEGVTYGYGTASDIHQAYNNLHYSVHAISNYQCIDTNAQSSPGYISSYEHGYNLLKSHQLVIGARDVCWKDYLLPQTISNKQEIFNRIRAADTSALISINHPMVRNGYGLSDIARLANYNCMEVLNPACNSSHLWDVALSAGKPIFIIGDDDAHNFADTNRVGKICTWINVPELNKKSILTALKTGCSFAMTAGSDLMQKERRHNNDSTPMLQNFIVHGNRIQVKFNLPAKKIRVIGENGRLLKEEANVDSLYFTLGAQEPYARIVVLYGNETQLLLNPVFRYHDSPLRQAAATINSKQTIILRSIGVVLIFFWFILLYSRLIPKKIKILPLQIIYKQNHGYESGNASPKIFQIWNRGFVRNVYRFFYNMAMQRKGETE